MRVPYAASNSLDSVDIVIRIHIFMENIVESAESVNRCFLSLVNWNCRTFHSATLNRDQSPVTVTVAGEHGVSC